MYVAPITATKCLLSPLIATMDRGQREKKGSITVSAKMRFYLVIIYYINRASRFTLFPNSSLSSIASRLLGFALFFA